jgi:hypothetical protein
VLNLFRSWVVSVARQREDMERSCVLAVEMKLALSINGDYGLTSEVELERWYDAKTASTFR